MNILIYKECVGQVTYDDEAKIFHGEVIGLKDEGTNPQEIEQAFKDSINAYLIWCRALGE